MKKKFLMGAVAAAAIALAAPANASTFILDLADFSSGLGVPPNTAPFGEVEVTANAGNLDFKVSLYDDSGSPSFPYHFHQTNNNHDSFAFSLVGDPNIKILNLAGGNFSVANALDATTVDPSDYKKGAFNESPFGTWDYAIKCSTCTGGGASAWSNSAAGPLTFTVDAVNALTVNDFANAAHTKTLDLHDGNGPQQYIVYASADIIAHDGTTGNVGAIPEPSTWALLIAGFGLIGFAMRRRPTEQTALA